MVSRLHSEVDVVAVLELFVSELAALREESERDVKNMCVNGLERLCNHSQ